FDLPRQVDLMVRGDYWGGLDTLPEFQNVASPATRLFSTRARFHFRDVRSSLGHVDDEKGIEWRALLDHDRVLEQDFVRVHGDLDLGLALPLGHASLWVRSSAGARLFGDREEPFAAFFFGGFGNNWVDRGAEKRYREHYSFPGVELNEVGGTSFVKSMLELNLPPLRFRRLGTPGLHVTWARPALFTSALVTDPSDGALRRTLTNVGGQVDFRFTILSALDMTLSAGYAAAFEDGHRPRREGMVSLKLLK
ncbi:MAG TPA: hypothetical protein VFM29_00075, partial [Vicinamibacteria bacterium]|nr:hypothetical protein [Vicinamibacteria bacterium]